MKYTIEDGTAILSEVSSKERDKGRFVVPKKIDGENVERVSFKTFSLVQNYAVEIWIPEGVTYVASRTFAMFPRLKSVSLPDSVECVGDELFADCRLLSTVRWSKNCSYIPRETFLRCVNLSILKNISEVKRIEKRAFSGCYFLQDFSIFKNCIEFGPAAFENTRFKNINMIGFALKQAGKKLFADSQNIENVFWAGNCDIPQGCFENAHTFQARVFIPDSVKNVGENAFLDARGSYYIHWPKNATQIQAYTFNLTTGVVFDDGCLQSVQEIDEGAFFECQLESLEFRDLRYIGPGAFERCSVSEIIGLDNVLKIEERAFSWSHVTNIQWPNHCSVIPKKCFYGSTVSEIHGLQNVETIESYAFSGCENLKKLDFSQGSLISICSSSLPEDFDRFVPSFDTEIIYE